MTLDRQAVKEAVRARVDLVELVGRYVGLRQQGTNFVGLCPFHEEKTPSFTVSPSKGVFHCFGCKAGGDVFAFVMRIEKLDFPQALARLAQQAGVDLPQGGSAPSADLQLRELSEQVARHFERALEGPPGTPARQYLHGRGIDDAVARAFRLGYAPPGWQHLMTAFRRDLKGLKTLGLTVISAKGRSYDRFRGRLMFALCDPQGDPVGFAGRKLESEEAGPKYVNTPTTPLLKKGTLLYGVHLAAEAARADETLVLVEGYTDVIAAHQHGVKNAVASMGTALTSDQARLCARLAKRIVLAFDQDSAGQQAMLRGVQALLEADLDVRLLQLAPGTDPDAFIRQRGADAFRAALDEAQPFFEVYVEMLATQHDVTTFSGKRAMLATALPFFRGLSNLHWRNQLVERLARTLDLPYEELERELRAGARPPGGALEAEEAKWHPGLEEELIYYLIHGHVSVERATAELEKAHFTKYGGLWEALVGCYQRHGTIRMDVLEDHVDTRWRSVLHRLGVADLPLPNPTRAVDDVILQLKMEPLDRTIRHIEAEIRRVESEGDHQRAKQLQIDLLEAKRQQGQQRHQARPQSR